MTDQQFTVGVKVEADTKSASTDVQGFKADIDALSTAGADAAAGLDAGAAAASGLGEQAATAGTKASTAFGELLTAGIGAGTAEVEALSEAFDTLGVNSAAALQSAALEARDSFTVISNSGKATQVDIDTAFAAMSAAYLKAAAAAEEGGAAQIATALRLEAANQAQLDSVIALQASYGVAARSAQTVEQAFDQLGVKSASSLVATAQTARDSFQTIQASGVATQADLDAAFAKVAEAEFAAGAAATEAGAEQVAAALRAQAANQAQLDSIIALEAAYGVEGAAAAAAGEKAAEGSAVAKEGIGLASEALLGLAGISIGVELLKSLAEIADEAKNVSTRLKLATGDTAEFEAAQAGVFEVAQKTGVALSSSAETYYKLSQAVKQLKGDGSDTLTVLTAINEAVTLSGVSAQTANNGIIQLAQGLASGRLQGQDLRAVLEDLPALGKAVADSLGVTTGELRKLGEQGALTPQEILGALEKAAPQIAQQFEQIPLTVGRSLTELKNSFTIALGSLDQTTGASASLASSIEDLARIIDELGASGRVKDAFNAIGSFFKLLVVDPISLGIDTVGVAFDTLEATVDGAAAAVAFALSKITFGDTSKVFAAAADSLGQDAKAAADKVVVQLGRIPAGARDAAITAEDAIGATVGALGGLSANAETAATRVGTANEKAGTSFLKVKDASGQVSDALLGTLSPATADLIKGFNSSGDAAGVAAKSATSFADEAKKAGLSAEDTVRGLAALDAAGKITAEDFDQQLSKVLKGVSSQDLPALTKALTVDYAAAVQTSAANTTQLRAALDALRDESLAKLGVDAKQVITGISSGMTEAIASVRALGSNTETTAAVMTAALNAAISKSTTKEDAQALLKAIQELGLQGDQAATLIARIKERIGELPALASKLDPLTDAFHTLGLKTTAELDGIATKAADAYAKFTAAGQHSAEEQATAFGTVADAQLKAAASVSDAALQSTASALEAAAQTDQQREALNKLIAAYPQLIGQLEQQDNLTQAIAADTAAADAAEQQLQADQQRRGQQLQQQQEQVSLTLKQQQANEAAAEAANYNAIINLVAGAEKYYASIGPGAEKAFDRVVTAATQYGESVTTFFDRLDAGTTKLNQQIAQQANFARALTENINAASGASDFFILQGREAVQSMQLLDKQSLSNLTAAIDGAQQRLKSLRDTASSTLSSLQDELDQLQGNQAAIQARQDAAQKAQIEAQLAQAKGTGDKQSIADLQQALDLLNKITDVRAQQAKQAQTAQIATAPTTATAPAAVPATAATTPVQTLQPVKVVQFQVPGLDTISVLPQSEAPLTALLQALTAAKRVSA